MCQPHNYHEFTNFTPFPKVIERDSRKCQIESLTKYRAGMLKSKFLKSQRIGAKREG